MPLVKINKKVDVNKNVNSLNDQVGDSSNESNIDQEHDLGDVLDTDTTSLDFNFNPKESVVDNLSETADILEREIEDYNQDHLSKSATEKNIIEPSNKNEVEPKIKFFEDSNSLQQDSDKFQVDKEVINLQEDNSAVDTTETYSLNNNSFSGQNLKQALTLEKFLYQSIQVGASDLHLSVGYRGIVRVDGRIEHINSPILSKSDLHNFVGELIRDRKNISIEDIYEYDMTYVTLGRRFRVNIFRSMGNFSIVFRLIPGKISTLEDLNIPQNVSQFTKFPSGLILVTGPTGSGKSTTIASLLNIINVSQKKHIVTLEDPIEFVFPRSVGLIDQREYGIDFETWPNALRSVLRQDPDVVFVGEMRDLETIESALQISETGHLVFATLHTNSASQTIDRIIDVFPAQKQEQIKIQLSTVIRAVLCQRLIPITSGGRRASIEILVATPAVKNSIRESSSAQIDNLIQTGSEFGMISMEKSLVNLVRSGIISSTEAKLYTNKPAEIDILLKSNV